MIQKKVVVALGGNALGNTPLKQRQTVKLAAKIIGQLVADGNQLIIGHGNGPQVGMIQLAMDYAASHQITQSGMPLVECGAMSQGYIGYHLQQAIQTVLNHRHISQSVVSVITQVEVDTNDPAFHHPTKPVGNFYTKEQAQQMSTDKGFTFIEDAGRGYRRVVPSPNPKTIIELEAIHKMLNQQMLVITVGGGGIPVIRTSEGLTGVDAVIDKDKSCSRLATDLDADILLILTAVDQVCIHFNQPEQQPLSQLTVTDAKKYIAEGHFAPGSMLPKIEACLDFVESKNDRQAIITSLAKAKDALNGLTGTCLIAD